MPGPLTGLRVVELGGMAVLPSTSRDWVLRGRMSVGADLKDEAGKETVLRLIDEADVVIEGFRPGVTEQLGVGPEDCLARTPRLISARMPGWAQNGPLARPAGHDINYIPVPGVPPAIGTAGTRPT